MKKQFLTTLAVSTGSLIFGQVGINNTSPKATLDITAKNATGTTTIPEGVIIPRVDRQRAASMTSVITSTLIYVNDVSTGAASGTAVNIDALGFYYYDGSVWQKLGAGGSALTLYSGDGALAGNRIVSQNANTLAFTGTATNAFSVDGNTFSVDAANHRVGLGMSSPATRLDIAGTGGSDDDIFIRSYASSSNAGALYFYKAAGTLASPTAVANGENLGEFNFGGYDGTAGRFNAGIRAYVNGSVSTGNVPVDLQFSTGITSPAERMRIASTGNIGIATNAPAATLDIAAKTATGTSATVDGVLIPRVDRQRAGSMTSVPVSTLIYINSVANGALSGSTQFVDAVGFYYSDGTNWQKLGASTTTAALNVTTELDANYTALATDDIILFNTTAQRTLTLPTSGITVGKRYYISLIGSNGVDFLPASAIRNSSYPGLNAGTSGTIIYLGGGKWDVVSGY